MRALDALPDESAGSEVEQMVAAADLPKAEVVASGAEGWHGPPALVGQEVIAGGPLASLTTFGLRG